MRAPCYYFSSFSVFSFHLTDRMLCFTLSVLRLVLLILCVFSFFIGAVASVPRCVFHRLHFTADDSPRSPLSLGPRAAVPLGRPFDRIAIVSLLEYVCYLCVRRAAIFHYIVRIGSEWARKKHTSAEAVGHTLKNWADQISGNKYSLSRRFQLSPSRSLARPVPLCPSPHFLRLLFFFLPLFIYLFPFFPFGFPLSPRARTHARRIACVAWNNYNCGKCTRRAQVVGNEEEKMCAREERWQPIAIAPTATTAASDGAQHRRATTERRCHTDERYLHRVRLQYIIQ